MVCLLKEGPFCLEISFTTYPHFIKKTRLTELFSFLGPIHGDEINYVLGTLFGPADVTIPANDVNLSKAIIKMWVNFARTGYVHFYDCV